jgi:hypothetical protein
VAFQSVNPREEEPLPELWDIPSGVTEFYSTFPNQTYYQFSRSYTARYVGSNVSIGANH